MAVVTRGIALPLVELVVLLSCFGLTMALAMPPLRVEASLAVRVTENERPEVSGKNGPCSQAYTVIITVTAAGPRPSVCKLNPCIVGLVINVSFHGLLSLVMSMFVVIYCRILSPPWERKGRS